MTMPNDRNALHFPRATPQRVAFAQLLMLLAFGTAPVLAQDEPVFQVPVLEDVDPASVEFNDRIIERDRTQPGLPTATDSNGSAQADGSNGGMTSAGGVGAAGGASGGGGYGRVPSVFQGAPQMPGASAGGSGSGDGDGGIDVNVSVSGQQVPNIFGDQGAGVPGMPGSTGGSPGMPGMPGSSSGSSGGADGSSSGGDGDGGIDVNVNVVGGKQMPTFSIPGMEGSSSGGMPGMPGMPGSMPGMPGMGLPGMDSGSGSSSGSGSASGSSSGNGSVAGNSNGNGSSSGNGTFGSAGGAGSGGMGTIGGGTGRGAVLDRRLEESFGVFDGMIIAEREKAQSEADAAGSSVMGTGGGADGEEGMGGEGGFGGAPEGAIVVATGPQNSTGGGMLPPGSQEREGEFSHSDQPTYPIPEDIPSGDDDDVVARQLREAAMSEPDPELREKLWDEYRKYTGLTQ